MYHLLVQQRLVSGRQDGVADGGTINITVTGLHFVSLTVRDQTFASQSDDLKTRWRLVQSKRTNLTGTVNCFVF